MIIDCHTQIWNAQSQSFYAGVDTSHPCAEDLGPLSAGPVDKSIVFALKSSYLGAEIPNRFVAEYIRRNPGKMIGFAGIDPTDRNWLEELRIAQQELSFRGAAICPPLQNYHPADTRAMRFFEECAKRAMPVLVESNPRNPASKMEFSQPMLLDEVAREFPSLKLVVARLGYPWVHQAVVLLAKHPNVYANIAGLLPHPWLSYSSLLAAHEFGVLHKLLFGSDYPFRSPTACIEALYSVNQFSHASALPPIPREHLRGIVERDALSLLGIGRAKTPGGVTPPTPIFSEEE